MNDPPTNTGSPNNPNRNTGNEVAQVIFTASVVAISITWPDLIPVLSIFLTACAVGWGKKRDDRE